jgi:L,D-transpeptidase catalytic domain
VTRHRDTRLRPRYARMGAAGASLAVTLVAVMGGFGVLPVSSGQANASGDASMTLRADDSQPTSTDPVSDAGATKSTTKSNGNGTSADATESQVDPQQDATLPVGSGTGKRVVFSESRQRVWLVNEDEQIERTYLVSGSVHDNLDPGAFQVYSRSEDAWGVDDSGSMKYFVRFTQGDTGAAIGFHDIPIKDGVPAQTEAQLGTPLSHGCVRQRRSDAIALWKFAPLGTSVIVTA